MNYLLTPLHKHYDLGFGGTGSAFKEAADALRQADQAKGRNVSNAQLPINFLYRHSIELHLKSAIVVLHRRLNLPYGTEPFDGDPMVLVDGRWKPFKQVHGIGALWEYVKVLFGTNAEWLSENTQTSWEFDASLDEDVKTIEAGDPRSTFFRYPTIHDPDADAAKSSMKEIGRNDFEQFFSQSTIEPQKLFIVENEQREFVRGYRYENSATTPLSEALRRLATTCDGMHVAIRAELCGGW